MVIDMKLIYTFTAIGLAFLPIGANAQTIVQDTFFGDNYASVQTNVYPQRRVIQQTRKVYKTYKTEKVVNNNTTNNYNTTVVQAPTTPPSPAPATPQPETKVEVAPAPTTNVQPVPQPVPQPNVVVNINPPVARNCVEQVITLDPYSGYPLAAPYVIRSPGCY